MALFATRRKGNHENLAIPFVGDLGKIKDISGAVEVDAIDGSIVSMVESYWFHQVLRLTSDDNVMR